MADSEGSSGMRGMGDGPPNRNRNPRLPALKPDVMRPSRYKQEMSMTTAERHRAFSDVRELDRRYAGRRPYKAFTVIPHRIVFQRFERCDTQEQQVLFRNDDCIPHLLRVLPSTSPYISVALVSAQGGKLAPGMFVAYRITFRPEEQCDYYHELQCTSDQVTFTLPVEAIGPRAILDFPDRVLFQNQPVHAEASRLLSVKNVGQKAAQFSLSVPEPFAVEPRCGRLAVDQVAQVRLRFLPTSVGQHSQHAQIAYDNGETVSMELHGCGVEVDVGLSSYTVRADTTFIGLVSRKTVRLYNGSATPASFVWRAAEVAPPQQTPPSAASGASPPATAEQRRRASTRDPSFIPSLSAGARVRLPPVTERPDAAALVEPTFQHPIFSIEPLRGEVWPDSAVELTVMFQPAVEGETSCIAFCQVTGRSERLALHLSGRGRGADVQLSLDTLDIGAVFKHSVFNYEVVAVNRGDIAATLRPRTATSAWAQHISFSPTEMQLHPKDHSTLVLTLDAQILGGLDEVIRIEVDGASEPLTLVLRGRVVPPTLAFDTPLLDFGVCAFGFRSVLRCRLRNTSLVPVQFSLAVTDDGETEAVRQDRLTTHLYQVVRHGLSSKPREFSLRPAGGLLQPSASVQVEVELVPNVVRHIATQLRVGVVGVAEAVHALPVSAQCVAADVRPRAPDVLLGRHFKGRSAPGALTLVNASAVPARYFVLPQLTVELSGVTYSCVEPTGVVEAHSTATVPFIVQLQALGELSVPIRVLIFGRAEPLSVVARVAGQGPVVDIQPPSLDWGVIGVLTPQHRSVLVSNQAPVPAAMYAHMQRPNSFWSVEPSEATIGPEQTLCVRLTALLDDNMRYFDLLVIDVVDSGSWEIPVSAHGRGSSVVFEPAFRPVVHLGPIFCKSPVSVNYLATNRSRRFHQLVWTNDGVVAQSVTSLPTARTSAAKLGRRTAGAVPVFRVSPRRIDLNPSETRGFTLEAYCESVGRRREELTCTATVAHSSGKLVLQRVVITADFIEPDIQLSHREMRFDRRQLPGARFDQHMSQVLTMTNRSPLALTTHVGTQYPFLVRNGRGALSAEIDLELGVHCSVGLEIVFDPDYVSGLTSRHVRDKLVITYEEHPLCDEVSLVGAVSFPNLTVSDTVLDFGCILNDMESFRQLKIANCSKVPVLYEWYFVDSETELEWLPDVEEEEQAEEQQEEEAAEEEENILRESRVERLIRGDVERTVPVECHTMSMEEYLQATRRRRVSKYSQPRPALDRLSAAEQIEALWKKQSKINEILDIYPLRGQLQPGDDTTVVFKFYGHGSVKFATRAVCVVEGGPQYSVQVSGRASSIRYRLETNHIDCGGSLYCQFLEVSTRLVNTGQVEFPWRLQYDSEQGRLQVTPTEGVLPAGGEQLVVIHFLPMLPDNFERTVLLMVAHFPAEPITLRGHGAYPAVMLDVPLVYSGISELVFLQAVQNISAMLQLEQQQQQQQQLPEWQLQTSIQNILSPQASDDVGQAPATGGAEHSTVSRRSRAAAITAPPAAELQTTATAGSLAAEQAVAASGTSVVEVAAPPDSVGSTQDQGAALTTGPAAAPPASDAASDALAAVSAATPAGQGLRLELSQPSEESAEGAEHAEGPEEEDEEEAEDLDLGTPPLSPSWSVISNTDSDVVEAALVDLEVERLVTVNFIKSHPTTAAVLRGEAGRRNAVCLDLLKYQLDFGLVLLGSDLHRAITVTNISQIAVSLQLLSGVTGEGEEFSVSLQLAAAEQLQVGESTFINVRLRPTTLQQPVERVERMVYLEVRYGLFIPIVIKATVTMPTVEMDRRELSFGTVYLGMCRVSHIKLHNSGVLPAHWSLTVRLAERALALPFSGERQRRLNERLAGAAPVFSFRPADGTLQPDQWRMVEVLFAPAKARTYVMEAILTVQGSTDTSVKRLTGDAVDISLEISTPELDFGAIVPYSGGAQMSLMVVNPHPVPVEIYSLEFDRQYLEEEHVLRQLPGYSEWQQLQLPPRRPGEPLPAEVRTFYTQLVQRASAAEPAPGTAGTAGEPAATGHTVSRMSLDGATRATRTHSRLVAQSASHAVAGASPRSLRRLRPSSPGPAAAAAAGTADSATSPASAAAAGETATPAGGEGAASERVGDESVGESTEREQSSPPTTVVESHAALPPQQAAPASDGSEASCWPGWAAVADQPAMWNLPAQEQFIKDFVEARGATLEPPLGDPAAEALQNHLRCEQPADHLLLQARRAPAFVLLSAPYTEPYLLAILLADRYGLVIRTLDELVWESVLSAGSPIAHSVRDYLCDSNRAAAAKVKRGGAGGRVSVSTGRRRTDSVSSLSQPTTHDLRSQLRPRPLPPATLAELIAARLLQEDAARGVVIWDVHGCQWSGGVVHALTALLIGVGRRRFSYFITLQKTLQQYRQLRSGRRRSSAAADAERAQPGWQPPQPTDSQLLLCDEQQYQQLQRRDQLRLDQLLSRGYRQRLRERRDDVRRLQDQMRAEHEKRFRKQKGGPAAPSAHKQPSHHKMSLQEKHSEARKQSVRKQSAMSKGESRASLRRSDFSVDNMYEKKKKTPRKKVDEEVLSERELEDDRQAAALYKAFGDALPSVICLLDMVDRQRLTPEGMPTDDQLKLGSTAHKRNTRARGRDKKASSAISKRATNLEELRVSSDLGVTHVLLDGALDSYTCFNMLVNNDIIPRPEHVKDHLGTGAAGPRPLPSRLYSLVKYPALRPAPDAAQPAFTFAMDEQEKAALAAEAAERELERAQKTAAEKSSPSRRRGKARKKERHKSELSLSEQRTATSTGTEADVDLGAAIRQSLQRDEPPVSGHRWVVAAESELLLTVHFDANRPGSYNGQLQLEVAGSRRRYTLSCSGSCVLPLINRKIKTLYSKVLIRAEEKPDQHGVAFVKSTRTLAFGPLPVVRPTQRAGRQRESTAAGAAPPPLVPSGHSAEVTMENVSPLPVEISFYLFNDTYKTPPFLIWPQQLQLAPGERDQLQLVALPPAPQLFEDMLIGCVKDNPDPWITKVTCVGARPEVHLDKKVLTFERVLLLRHEVRKLTIANKSLIPLSFRFADTEQLGDAFTFTPMSGTLLPLGAHEVEVDFAPIRPCLMHNKKIKVEITEPAERVDAVEEAAPAPGSLSGRSAPLTAETPGTSPRSPRSISNTLGVLQTDVVTVAAEGFDVAVDLMLPKGLATGIDFGTIKVQEEAKQTFTIKNKGKYEIMFKAWLEDPEPAKNVRPITHGFQLAPERGVLHPHDKPLSITLTYNTDQEREIRRKELLRVQIVDYHRKEAGEVIALIPVCVTARALFCQFSVEPSNELNLGFFPVTVRKAGFFVINNDGKFDFNFYILRKNVEPAHGDSPREKSKKRSAARGASESMSSHDDGHKSNVNVSSKPTKDSSKTTQGMAKGSFAQEGRQQKLQAGIYTLQPAMGTVGVGSQVVVHVEAVSGEPITDVQDLVIRISDAGDGNGIPFRLRGAATVASIRRPDNTFTDIFEEHTVVESLGDYDPAEKRLAVPLGGVYGLEEKRFLIQPTIVGDAVTVTFKVPNTCMVPVDIVVSIKPPGPAPKAAKGAAADVARVFEVSPTRTSIAPHGSADVRLTFTPSALQSFTNVLDIQIEESTGIDRNKGIVFEVVGEGTLPRVEVLQPAAVNRQLEPTLGFLSTRLGDVHTATVRLQNTGLVESMVDLLMPEGRDVFTVEPAEESMQYTVKGQVDGEHGMISDSGYVLGVLRIPAGCQVALRATFRPRQVGPAAGALLVNVNFNDFLRPLIRLNGHGFCNGVVLHGLPCAPYVPPSVAAPASSRAQKEPQTEPPHVIAADMPQLQYGLEFTGCYIGATHRRQFRLENCSDRARYRFQWTNTQYLTFSPALGHLAPREMKTLTVTFVANEAIHFGKAPVQPTTDLPPERKRGRSKPEASKIPEHPVSCVVTSIEYVRAAAGAPPQVDGVSSAAASAAAPAAEAEEAPPAGSWDERSKSLQLVPVQSDAAAEPHAAAAAAEEEPELCSRLLPEPEPAFAELAPTPALRLELQAVLQTDLPRVRFSQPDLLLFDDTYMFQTRTQQISLENVGQAEVRYSWAVSYEPPAAPRVDSPTQVASAELASRLDEVAARRSSSARQFLSMMHRRYDQLADYVPFGVRPETGVVAPGQTAQFDVQFSPLDTLLFSATLKCSIPFLPEEAAAPVVRVQGRGVLPVCHFDLEHTTCQERDDLDVPSSCDLRVITIQAVGVNRKISKSFSIVNPTEASWHFTFALLDTAETAPSNAWFSCTNLSGVVHPGQRAGVTFEFLARKAGTFRSRWQFMVMEHVLAVELLLVGHAREPRVYAAQPRLTLLPVLRGLSSQGVLTLVNQEETPYRFQLDLDSCYSANQALKLGVQPIEGVIPAQGTTDVGLQYQAQVDGVVEFGLRLRLEMCQAPLAVAVRGEGYTQLADATLAVPGGRPRKLSSNNVNQLDLGLIPCRDVVYRTVDVVNAGAFPFCLEMQDDTEIKSPRITVTMTPTSVIIEPRERVTCKFGISCATKVKFSNIKIMIRVVSGPEFLLLVRGSAEPPTMLYSLSTLDYGPCFLHEEGMPPNLTELKVENKDKNAVSVGVQVEDVPYFKVDFKQAIIGPSEKATIPITFVPSETRRYSLPLTVVVNGQVHRTIPLSGDGVRFQVEVAHPQYKQLVLGTFRAGQRLQRSVTVVNRAGTAVKCKFQLTCKSPELQNLTQPVLRLRPAEADLRPHSSVVLELLCFSKTRLPWFQEEVLLSAVGRTSTLLTVEGVCQGLDLALDVASVPFGPVAAYSRVTRNVCIINDGDLGAKFRWSAESLQPEFAVEPLYGYSAPKTRVVCQITFQPKQLANVIKKEGVTCDVENFGSLPLTVVGACVPVTPAKEPLVFQTSVRTEDVKTIQIPNKSNSSWELTPVISGAYWSGAPALTVPAQTVAAYAVTYRPQLMTAAGQRHTGSVYVALPDGQATLYSLLGTAEPPQPEQRLVADISCKTAHRQTVALTNWLTEPQRFTCRAELVRGEKDKTDGSAVQTSGLEIMDVPALNTVPYTLTVFCFKEGNFHIKLTFLNERSGEFIFYELVYRVGKLQDRQPVYLNTVVRKPVSHSVALERPLEVAMSCQVSCSMPEIVLAHHGTVHFAAGQQARVAFDCLPLREGDWQGALDVHSPEMGGYGFQVHVSARRAPPAGRLQLRCPLGQSVTKQIRFTNYSRTRAEYATQLVSPDQLGAPPASPASHESAGSGRRRATSAGSQRDDEKPRTFAELLTQLQQKGESKELSVDRTVTAAPAWPHGAEASFDVTFEPCDVGTVERGLVLSSPAGGEYRFELEAVGAPPEPQGPITVRAGGSVPVTFKNVFPAVAPFTYQVDSPCFSLGKTPDTIRPKKDVRISVSFDPTRAKHVEVTATRPATGCLTICGPTLPRGLVPVWRYFLRGVPSDRS